MDSSDQDKRHVTELFLFSGSFDPPVQREARAAIIHGGGRMGLERLASFRIAAYVASQGHHTGETIADKPAVGEP